MPQIYYWTIPPKLSATTSCEESEQERNAPICEEPESKKNAHSKPMTFVYENLLQDSRFFCYTLSLPNFNLVVLSPLAFFYCNQPAP
jgi:hypothetical protein